MGDDPWDCAAFVEPVSEVFTVIFVVGIGLEGEYARFEVQATSGGPDD